MVQCSLNCRRSANVRGTIPEATTLLKATHLLGETSFAIRGISVEGESSAGIGSNFRINQVLYIQLVLVTSHLRTVRVMLEKVIAYA
jgi:hypothetical protein